MGDDSNSGNNSNKSGASSSIPDNYAMPSCRSANQPVAISLVYDDLYNTPVAETPYTVICAKDPSSPIKGVTDADGKAQLDNVHAGPLTVTFHPENDTQDKADAAQLRKELERSLDTLVMDASDAKAMHERMLSEYNLVEKGAIYTGAIADGLVTGVAGYGEMVAAVGSVLASLGKEYLDIYGAILTGDIKALQAKLEQAEAAGQAFADSSRETAETLFLLMSDEEAMAILKDFPERYWDAHHSLDKAHMAGTMGTDLVVGALMAAATGAVGTSAVGAKMIATGGPKVAKVVETLTALATKLKKTKAKKTYQGRSGGAVDGKVTSTASNGPLSGQDAGHLETTGKNPNGDTTPKADKTVQSSEPISMITGEELLPQTDFIIGGLIPLEWKRFYRTSNPVNRGLGHGWTYPVSETLQIGNDSILFHDAEGRRIEFPVPAVGQFTSNRAEGLILHCDWHNVYYLKQPGQPDKLFAGDDIISGARSATLRLKALIDPVGNRWDCFYNDQTQLIERMESTWGSTLLFEANARGMIGRIREQITPVVASSGANQSGAFQTNAYQTKVSYHYDEQRDLIAVEDAGGDAEQFRYQNHIITQRTLRSGFNFYFQWDQYTPKARCIRQWGDDLGDGAIYDYHFEWDPDNRISRSYDSYDNLLEIHYNEHGLPDKEIDPEGNTTCYEYDRCGRKTKVIDPLGNEQTFTYDKVGNLTYCSDAAGGGFTQLYDLKHRPISFLDAEGNTWSREYNEQGLVSKTTDAEGNVVQYFYNDVGLPQIIIDPNGDKQILAWNAKGQLITRATGNEAQPVEPTHYRYDQQGNVATVEQGGRQTRYTHDQKGDVVAIHYPDGGRASLNYNASRQLTQYTDALGRTTRFQYDGLAQVVRRIDPNGQVLHYQYDLERNLIGLINENGERYQLKYDKNERLIEEVGFDGRVQQYQYDPLGHLTTHIEGLHTETELLQANSTHFKRDALGRMLKKQTPDGNDAAFSYDRNGRLASAVNRARTLAFKYSPNGHLLAEKQDQSEIHHEYNALGHRIGSILPNGETIAYQFNQAGQFTALDYNGQRITELQRNSLGQEIARTQGTLQAGSDYDPAGRLTRHWVQRQHSREALIDRQYQYDGAGRLHQIDDLRKGRTAYHYDALDRLTAVDGYASEQFDFDPAGNILSGTANSETQNQPTQKTSPGNRLRFHGDRHFTYDPRGNLIQERRGTGGKIQTRYHYNSQNQLTTVEKGGQNFHYEYDPLGRRVRKSDAFGETEFVWNGDVLLSEKRGHKEKLYLYEPNSFKPLAFVENNQCYF
ncbi:hypothetical protein FT643_19450, partial [Ketobacter sp. MCCC 1A13808]|uniref:DUF6531 domain-containing protein n=1 Tax=Ketobacter sp. MCCC 1A13808 TaxID=2602738 RepID=UPI0012EB3B07